MESLTIEINAPLQPIHRGEHFEDPIDEFLANNQIGVVDGGGTLLEESGRPTSCDIFVVFNEDFDLDDVYSMLEDFEFPKGSQLVVEGERHPIGTLEGVTIQLDGTGLGAEVYANNDINELLASFATALGEDGKLLTWYEGKSETTLYFYGDSAVRMQELLAPVLTAHPFGEGARIEPIT